MFLTIRYFKPKTFIEKESILADKLGYNIFPPEVKVTFSDNFLRRNFSLEENTLKHYSMWS